MRARATHELHTSDKEQAQPFYQQTWRRAGYHMLTHAIKLNDPFGLWYSQADANLEHMSVLQLCINAITYLVPTGL